MGRINEEHLNISNLGITKVSTELKMARSLVRLAEIQATLQEQRILFLRQQSIDLESMRPRLPYVHSINSNESSQNQNQNHHHSHHVHHHHHLSNAQATSHLASASAVSGQTSSALTSADSQQQASPSTVISS